jgi:hypothetical protein
MNPQPNPFAGLTVQASGADPLPPGVYFAVYKGVEPFSNEKVNGKLKFTWEVASGTHKGKAATALTDRNLTPNTHAGRLITGLVGRPLAPKGASRPYSRFPHPRNSNPQTPHAWGFSPQACGQPSTRFTQRNISSWLTFRFNSCSA